MGDGFALSSTSREVFYLWFCVGECDPFACRRMCAHRQTLTYPNKHTQTNVIHLESGLDSQCGRVFAPCFTINSGCFVYVDLLLVCNNDFLRETSFCCFHILTSSPPPSHRVCLHLLLREAQSDSCLPLLFQTCLLSETFLSRGTTIRAAPPPLPLCPCAALKGFPSWRLS